MKTATRQKAAQKPQGQSLEKPLNEQGKAQTLTREAQGGQCGCPGRIESISSRPVLTTVQEKIIRGVQTILYIPQALLILTHTD